MAKQNKKQNAPSEACGWMIPKALEIVKCKDGSKEYMREYPARKPYGNVIKVCEYSFDGVVFGEEDGRVVWKLAKRAARDFLRVSWLNAAVVTASKMDKTNHAVTVYGKY